MWTLHAYDTTCVRLQLCQRPDFERRQVAIVLNVIDAEVPALERRAFFVCELWGDRDRSLRLLKRRKCVETSDATRSRV